MAEILSHGLLPLDMGTFKVCSQCYIFYGVIIILEFKYNLGNETK